MERNISIPRGEAEKIVKDLREAGKFDTASRLEHLVTGGYSYDLEPTSSLGLDPDVERCEEAAATQWSVYKRPINPDSRGASLAEWVADFALHEKRIAQIVVDTLNERSDT